MSVARVVRLLVWSVFIVSIVSAAEGRMGERGARWWVSDLGLASGFQDNWSNHYRRGRSIVAADFDGDSRADFFIGNAGDESLILRNLGPGQGEQVRFAPDQVLLHGDLAVAPVVADYDNDGDLDLFVGCGGLEGLCHDFLFRNDSVPGQIRFTDVSIQAGILGPTFAGLPLAHATGGATWGDYDRDGDQDLYLSVVRYAIGTTLPYKNVLWNNNGDGTFTDATLRVNLDYLAYGSGGGIVLMDRSFFQASSWIDADNDGDLDLLLNNSWGPNVLWKSLLVEQGSPWFIDATSEFSLPGGDLRSPTASFASAVADFNNDGWQDLILFAASAEPYGPPGNGLFLNQGGRGFVNAASSAGINMPDGQPEVAMGCQVADLNADGIPDLVIGAGDPQQGKRNRLLLSTHMNGPTPVFEDASALIDVEPDHGVDPTRQPFSESPPYPYRTHGIAAVDADGDGYLDLAVMNGGRARDSDLVREPNRLFRFSQPGPGRTLRVSLRGNGVTDSRDAIGARAYVEIPVHGRESRRVFQTVVAGSGFGAQNELVLTFGLGGNRKASRLVILWLSGCIQVVNLSGRTTSEPMVVDQACGECDATSYPAEAWLDPDTSRCRSRPGVDRRSTSPLPR